MDWGRKPENPGGTPRHRRAVKCAALFTVRLVQTDLAHAIRLNNGAHKDVLMWR